VNLLVSWQWGRRITQEVFNGTIDEIKKQKVCVARDRFKEYEARR
jgi:hypothetical protein